MHSSMLIILHGGLECQKSKLIDLLQNTDTGLLDLTVRPEKTSVLPFYLLGARLEV